MDRKKRIIALGLIVAAAILLLLPFGNNHVLRYYHNTDQVFGTYYSIRYEGEKDIKSAIDSCLEQLDASLSMFNPTSTLSRINQNQEVRTDSLFERMYNEAHNISVLSEGAFDITVAPLVNLWGFGFTNKNTITQAKIDSILSIIGYTGISLEQHHLYKRDMRMQLDANAIAKGYACDLVAQLLEREGCAHYLVEIGGEVVAAGHNEQGHPWRIGITKPIDDNSGQTQELQDVIMTSKIAMATSGNYRNYYYEDGEKRSHTIDPRTGYPVQHKLLSATVTASSCMRADALATSCMVLGEKDGLALIESIKDAECYLIVSNGDSLQIMTSSGWKQ